MLKNTINAAAKAAVRLFSQTAENNISSTATSDPQLPPKLGIAIASTAIGVSTFLDDNKKPESEVSNAASKGALQEETRHRYPGGTSW